MTQVETRYRAIVARRRLNTAAPDLLAALDSLREQAEKMYLLIEDRLPDLADDDWLADIDNANDAITKAT
jgi:hypothetical protein